MSLESALDEYPKELAFKSGFKCTARPLEPADETAFNDFFLALPGHELMFIKHRVTDPAVIRDWCQHLDLGRNLPMLAIADDRIIGAATLHQQLGGWRRHIARVSVLIHPKYRGRGLAKAMVHEMIEIARQCGLDKIEAEFIGKQEGAMKMFALLGFQELVRLPDYVKDMQAIPHDYILMGMNLITDEEYAGME